MTTARSNPRFRHRLSRLGLHFLFVALFAIIGGSLRGFNLLLVLAGLLTSVVLIQWRVGRAAIRQIHIHREPIAGAFANQVVSIHYSIQNRARWNPVWSLRIEDRVQKHRVQKHSGDATDPDSIPYDSAPPASLICGIGHVPAGSSRSVSMQCRFRQRGQYLLGSVVGSTTFPFCLISCEQLSSSSIEAIYVYPRLIPMRDWTRLLPSRRGSEGTQSTGGTNLDGDFFGLRPWQSGDHIKHIHWRTTARIGVPAVRQFEHRNQHQVCIIVDGYETADTSHSDTTGLELVLAVATTLIDHLATPSRSVHLMVADAWLHDPIHSIQPLRSEGKQTARLLERLAIARPVAVASNRHDPLCEMVATVGASLQSYDLLVISSRSFRAAIQQIGAAQTDHAHSPGRGFWRRFSHSTHAAWIDVHAADVRRNLYLEPLVHQQPGRPIGNSHATH